MRKICNSLLGISLLLSPLLAFAGKFTYEFTKKLSAQVRIVRPPTILLTGRTLAIQQRAPVHEPELQQLGIAIEHGLVSEFSPAENGKPDLTLTYGVIGYQPILVRTYTQAENRYIQVGTKAGKDIFGKPAQTPVYDNRNVPVEYFEARGGLSLEVVVKDSSGVIRDSFSPSKDYLYKMVIAENGQSKLGRGVLPTRESLTGEMIGTVVQQVSARYTKTYETFTAPLAVDDELRPGDAYAIAGNWQAALNSWKSALMRKNQADQLYNEALAYEALASAAFDQTRSIEDSEPTFQLAVKNYQAAMQEDPGEKNYRAAATQMSDLEATFARAKEQYKLHQIQVAEAISRRREGPPALEAPAGKGIGSSGTEAPDTPDQAAFRRLIQVRLRSLPAEPAPAVQQQWEGLGHAYHLDPAASHRIISEECAHFESRQNSLKEYRSMVSDFASDHVIDRDEREQLNQLAQHLELSPQETRSVEAQFQFKEVTTPARQ